MAKRYRRNNDVGIALLIIIAIGVIGQFLVGVINFIQGNAQTILIGIGLIFLLITIIFIVRLVINSNRLKAIVQAYQNTPFYKDFNIPYKQLPKDRGHGFEIEIYNRLKQELGNSVFIHLNLLIPKLNAVNEYSEIDLVVLHSSGIYVIEVKNLSGPVTGNDDQEYWKPFIKSTNEDGQSSYNQNFAIKGFNEFGLYNPIKQNDYHILYLNALVPGQYINKVIFSDSMLVGSSKHPKIHTLNEFVGLLKAQNLNKYNSIDLKGIFDQINNVRVTDPNAIQLHTARLKSKKT